VTGGGGLGGCGLRVRALGVRAWVLWLVNEL